MAIKVNLLPPEYSVSGPLSKALKTLRTLNVILLAAFIIFATGLGGYILFSVFQQRSLNEQEAQLKAQVTAQQQSEQQLVLMKDRLGKIQTLKTVSGAEENLEKIDPLVASITGDNLLTELEVDSRKIDLSVLIRTNSQLSAFLGSLRSQEVFNTIVLSSFGFNPASGYLVSLNLN